jgi:hypothetical protein
MTTHVLKGSKQEIAETLAHFPGEVREAIVFVEDPATSTTAQAAPPTADIFDEMRPFMVDADQLHDSREAIYGRTQGE